MELVKEIMLEPRWDEAEFKLVKQQALSQIKQQEANPNSIAENEFRKLIYGNNHILAHNNLGTRESVEKIRMQDLKNYFNTNLSPLRTTFLAVGALDQQKALKSLKGLSAGWPPKSVRIPEFPQPQV